VENSSNIQKALEDIKEYVLYMRELGVEYLDADLSGFGVPARSNEPRVAAATAERREKYVPQRSEIIHEKKPEARGSRLNALPSLKNRKKENAVPIVKKAAEPAVQIPEPPKPEPPETMLLQVAANETIEDIRRDIGDCKRCALCEGRTQIVHSTGNFSARLMFVGEAPGADEDAQGKPFVGRAGKLLTKIIESIGLKREDVFIGNINRCRPPKNRTPLPDETATCRPFLLREVEVIKPDVIVVLGATAAHNLLQVKTPIGQLRGMFHDYFGVKVMPTFHPAYLLRDPHKKREVWEDMKKVRDLLLAKEDM
jgi:DNA polymerase